MAAVLALLSSLLWGLSDFLGGTASRRLPVPSVLGLSQLTGLLLLTGLAVSTGALDTPRDYLLPACVAGAVGICALGMFFRALSIGTMGVVAPVAALGVAVPVVVGLARGEQPSGLQVAGIVVAVLGVVLASGPELSGSGAGGAQALLLAVGAAAGFGVVLLFVAEASDDAATDGRRPLHRAQVVLVGDELHLALDHAADRLSYLVLSFGLLAIVAYRSLVDRQASWDLLGLVLLGAVVDRALEARDALDDRLAVRIAERVGQLFGD